METVSNLQPIPSQEFNTTLGDFTYSFRFVFCESFIAYDIKINDVDVITGGRILFGELLLIYPYQESDGNFILDIPSGDEPDYTQFNDTQFLVYLTQEETNDFREDKKNGRA